MSGADAPIVAAAWRALQLAWRRVGATTPNPAVGCVLLDAAGEVVAEAAHERAGEAHAEAAAIATARARGTLGRARTAIVTLEPCSHVGRTGACAAALLQTPVETVVFGVPDPHPRAPGRGLTMLREGGRRVIGFGELAHPDAASLARCAARLIEPFACAVERGRPFTTLKTALTADGSMIPPPGRKTFTTAESLTGAHVLRRRADAILTGSGCLLADDPAFTVRHVADHPGKRRILGVLDRRGRVSQAWLDAAAERGLNARRFDDLDDALAAIGEAGALEVLVEAGPTLRQAILDRGLWDEEVVFQQRHAGEPDAVRIRRRDGGDPFAHLWSSDPPEPSHVP